MLFTLKICLGSELDWNYLTEPDEKSCQGRSIVKDTITQDLWLFIKFCIQLKSP